MDGNYTGSALAIIKSAEAAALVQADFALSRIPEGHHFRDALMGLMMGHKSYVTDEYKDYIGVCLAKANSVSRAFRENSRGFMGKKLPSLAELQKSGALAKADLDVGTLTNFASIVGGQSLGYVSLDTRMARSTVRPNSFTLYQALNKTAAFQVVDYWSAATGTGAGLPGTAFQSYGNVATGTMVTNAGIYGLNNITLKLATDGRAITTALAAQNSFVDISAQENINAATSILTSVDWACYYGDPVFYPNMFAGLGVSIPTANKFDFQTFSNNNGAKNGWTIQETLFNMIYEVAGKITSFGTYGRITHAFMSPNTAASFQGLVTTLLNNITNEITSSMRSNPIHVNGDLRGMTTRFGDIQFPIDLFISARNYPASAIFNSNGVSYATTTAPTHPVAVTAAVTGALASGAAWTANYTASSGIYAYAVSSTDSASNESSLTYLTGITVSGVAAGGGYVLTIQPPGAADAVAFRVYRSGLGYAPASSGVANAASYRYIGTVAANGGSNVTFSDDNTHIPGSDNIYLLDLDEGDDALDFRFLLPLTKVELFAQNLFMPWAVVMIGALRNRIPKWHGMIQNYVPDGLDFDPLKANTNAQPLNNV